MAGIADLANSTAVDSDRFELERLRSNDLYVPPTIVLDRKQRLFVQHPTVVKLYSPLFIRCCANQYNLTVTAKGLKRRARQRFEAQLKARKMGTALSPGAMPAMIDGPKAEKPEEPWRENLNMHVICRECKEVPPNIVEEFSSGDMVCGSCGLVLGDRIVDTRSEWRTFSNDDGANDDPSRVGDVKNDLLNGDQLTTTIAFGDGLGKSRDLHRAQNKSTHDKSNKTLLAAYKEIGALCDAWNIPKNVSDTAKHLFKMVNDAGAFRGKSQEAIIAGCIFIACRQCKVPRTFREIFALTKVSKKEIGRIFKALEKFFAAQNKEKMDSMEKDGRIVNPNDSYNATESTKAQELCIRYCSQLRLSAKCTMVSQQLADKISSMGSLAGRSPLSSAAACIYFVSHLLREGKSPKEISAIAGVSDGTIRTAYKLLEAEKEKLIDPDWIKDGKGDIKLLPKV